MTEICNSDDCLKIYLQSLNIPVLTKEEEKKYFVLLKTDYKKYKNLLVEKKFKTCS